MRENLSRRAVTHARRDSLAAIAFEKNRRRVSNTCDLRCRLYFARLDARSVLARDHLHEVDCRIYEAFAAFTRLKAAFTRATFLQRDSKIFNA